MTTAIFYPTTAGVAPRLRVERANYNFHHMPLRREIGQLLIGSLPGVAIPSELRSLAREFHLGGVTLFNRNIEEPAQVAELSIELQHLSDEVPLWVAIDQEGGRVARLRRPFTEWPPMAALGRHGDERLARRFATALARELRAVGVSLDYAPVLDIHTNPQNPIIGDRALAESPEAVAGLGVAIIEALQEHGVAACGKHFPGHGDTAVDSHVDLPVVEHPPDRIRRVESHPFKRAIAADVAFIMTAHILVPTIDAERPATLSPAIVQGMLRDELHFNGVILSDDLEMDALAKTYSVQEAAVLAIAAGCDGVLVCRPKSSDRLRDIDVQVTVLEALIHAVEDGRVSRARVDDALRRQRKAKERFLAVPPSGTARSWRGVIGCDEHQRIAEEMRKAL
jgi:beta-N-acetylhexosaminidase